MVKYVEVQKGVAINLDQIAVMVLYETEILFYSQDKLARDIVFDSEEQAQSAFKDLLKLSE